VLAIQNKVRSLLVYDVEPEMFNNKSTHFNKLRRPTLAFRAPSNALKRRVPEVFGLPLLPDLPKEEK
jgi:hypothetical protein